MELITYTREETKVYRGKPTVRLSQVSGSITFSKTFTREAEIKHGDRLLFHQDSVRLKDWYVSKTDDPKGLKLRLQSNNQLMCTSKGMVNKILSSIGKTDRSAGFRMATKPTEGKYFAIITAEGI